MLHTVPCLFVYPFIYSITSYCSTSDLRLVNVLVALYYSQHYFRYTHWGTKTPVKIIMLYSVEYHNRADLDKVTLFNTRLSDLFLSSAMLSGGSPCAWPVVFCWKHHFSTQSFHVLSYMQLISANANSKGVYEASRTSRLLPIFPS